MEEYIVRVYDNRTEWRNKNGNLHRIDGPAVEFANGDKEWWVNGQRHRIGGPAYETSYGVTWWQHGELHRIDGPAIERSNGDKEWYIKGIEYTEAEYHKAMAPVKELTMPELEKLLGHKVKIKAETT